MIEQPPDIVFPFEQAEALRDELRRAANELSDATDDRAWAGGNVDPFEGGVADDYRTMFSTHQDAVTTTIERFRRLANDLDDAIDERRTTIQQNQEAWADEVAKSRF